MGIQCFAPSGHAFALTVHQGIERIEENGLYRLLFVLIDEVLKHRHHEAFGLSRAGSGGDHDCFPFFSEHCFFIFSEHCFPTLGLMFVGATIFGKTLFGIDFVATERFYKFRFEHAELGSVFGEGVFATFPRENGLKNGLGQQRLFIFEQMAQVILFFAEAAYPEVDHRVDELFAGFGVKIEVIHRRWEKGEEMSRVRWGESAQSIGQCLLVVSFVAAMQRVCR